MAEEKKKIIIKKKTQVKLVPKSKASATSQLIPPPPEIVSTQSGQDMGLQRNKADVEEPQIREPEPPPPRTTFKFYCIRCGQKLEAYYDWIDRNIQCPRCSVIIQIPEPPHDD